MSAYSSSVSYFNFNAITIPAVGTVALSMSRQPVDVTPIGSWNSYFIENVMSVSGTLDVYFNSADHLELTRHILTGQQQGAMPFAFTIATGERIEGSLYITSWDVVATTADVVRGQFAFVVHGQINYVNPVEDIASSLGTVESIPEP